MDNSTIEIKDLEYCFELISNISGLPVFLFTERGIELYKQHDQSIIHPVRDYHGFLYNQALLSVTRQKQQSIINTKLFGSFLCIRIELQKSTPGFVFVGPCRQSSTTDFDIQEYEAEFNLTSGESAALNNYFENLPMLDKDKLFSVGAMIHYLLFDEKLDSPVNQSVINADNVNSLINSNIRNEYELSLAENRVVGYPHRSPYYERQLCRYIREGNSEGLLKFLANNRLYPEFVLLSKDNLMRSRKNLAICLLTVTSRAAIEGGLRTELSYALTDVYIQRLEELTNINDIFALAETAYYDLSKRVRELQTQKLSRTIMLCQSYIHKHLNENIRVPELAKLLNLNKNYLSGLFKNETGMTISEYIMNEKIKEAKHMLAYTNDSILEIYASLDFCDQSHFTRMFKRNTGFTPKQFRKNHISAAAWKED